MAKPEWKGKKKDMGGRQKRELPTAQNFVKRSITVPGHKNPVKGIESAYN